MSGIYIHIPFCKQACHYCNFYFTTSKSNKNNILEAISTELKISKYFLEDKNIKTLYFGGGTPSFLEVNDLKIIFDSIQQYYSLENLEEITLEANPDDISEEKLEGWKKLGINRLSIGIQSFNDEELKLMNRSHNALQADKAIKMAKEFQFQNLSIDLIYGLPNSTESSWKRNLDKFVENEIPHLSCYSLTVKEKTKLMKMVNNGSIQMIEENKNIEQYLYMIDFLQKHGFEQYEISNFAINQAYSIHNKNYWNEKPYLGIGPSAHSYDGNSRRWNVANNNAYIQSLKNKLPYFEEEVLTTENRYNEYIITKLRTKWGLSPIEIKQRFGLDISSIVDRELEKGNIEYNSEKNIILSQQGKLIADTVTLDFISNFTF